MHYLKDIKEDIEDTDFSKLLEDTLYDIENIKKDLDDVIKSCEDLFDKYGIKD